MPDIAQYFCCHIKIDALAHTSEVVHFPFSSANCWYDLTLKLLGALSERSILSALENNWHPLSRFLKCPHAALGPPHQEQRGTVSAKREPLNKVGTSAFCLQTGAIWKEKEAEGLSNPRPAPG